MLTYSSNLRVSWFTKRRKGRYEGTCNLLRKYLGDFLIASYLEVVQDSGYDDTYIQEIEVGCFICLILHIRCIFPFIICRYYCVI